MPEEISFFSNEKGVRITNTRAIFGASTYVMSNISSVRKDSKPPSRAPGCVMGAIGLIVLLAGLGQLGSNIVAAIICIVTGIGFLGGLIYYTARAPRTYIVRIVTAGGEVSALESTNEKYIESIIAALNEAIVKRG